MIDELSTVVRLRRLLLAVVMVGFLGTAVDLVLLAHYEDPMQFAPFAVIASCVIGVAWHGWAGSRASLMFMRSVLAIAIVGAMTGVVLHYQGSMEFQLEMDPSLGGLDLLGKVMTSKAPPTLAPLNLAILGLVGLASTYRENG